MSDTKIIIGIDGGGTKTSAILFKIVSSDSGASSTTQDVIVSAVRATTTSSSSQNHHPSNYCYQYKTGSTNWNSVGDEVAKKNLFDALDGVLDKFLSSASIISTPSSDNRNGNFQKREMITHICLGMACVDTPQDKVKLTKWINEEYFEDTNSKNDTSTSRHDHKLLVFGDAIIALASGTLGKLHGITLISGTGIIAYGRNQLTKKEARSSGWGVLLGDEGSGYDIGAETLKLVMKRYDGRCDDDSTSKEATRKVLSSLLLQKLNLSSHEGLLDWAYSNNENTNNNDAAAASWDKIASLAPICFEAAIHHRDAGAIKILESRAEVLIQNLNAVILKVFPNPPTNHNENLEDGGDDTATKTPTVIPICLSGGIATNDFMFEMVIKKFFARPHHYLQFEFLKPLVLPEVAAALLVANDENTKSKAETDSIRLL